MNFGARESVEDCAVLLFGLQELAKENADDLLVANHAALGLELQGLRAVEQLGDHDRFRADVAQPSDEIGVGAFARTGGAAQKDQLLGESEVFLAVILL